MNTFLLVSKRQQILRRRIKFGAGWLNADLERERLSELSEIERGLTSKQLSAVVWLMNEYCYVGDWRRAVIIRKLADRRVAGWMREVLLLVGTNLDKSDRDIVLSQIGDREPSGPPALHPVVLAAVKSL